MIENQHYSKWNKIVKEIVVINIPFEYARQVIVHNNQKEIIVKNKQELEAAVFDLVKEFNANSFQTIKFEIDFDLRKIRKEVENRLQPMFSKFFKE